MSVGGFATNVYILYILQLLPFTVQCCNDSFISVDASKFATYVNVAVSLPS